MECIFCEFIFGENFMECMFCEFILGRTSWNVCFVSSFWGELHGMYVL